MLNKSSQSNVRRRRPKGGSVGTIIRRAAISFALTLVILIMIVWSLCFLVAHGPSESMRDLLVMSAMQASATKWVPYLVLSADEVEAIIDHSTKGSTNIITPEDLANRTIKKVVTGADGKQYEIEVLVGEDGSAIITGPDGNQDHIIYDEWATAIDGIQFITLSRPTFRAYMLIIKDPERVFVATSSDYKGNEAGKRFYEMADIFPDVVAFINGGEFYDPQGQGNGGKPNGLTFSRGECMWDDGATWKTFIGFDSNNKLVVRENYTKEQAIADGIRDGVCFKPGQNSASSRLIYTDESGNVHVSSYNSAGLAQRTAIGQRADGAVILLVTDGRSSASPGATYTDITQLMYEYGAVNAGMLDGGSSSILFYRPLSESGKPDYYYNVYDGYRYEALEEFQKLGLVNHYVAFTSPRRLPTYFAVGKAG